eukprot:Phypoly_transcript_00903.p1 GENE.Phypoly_transcript_00903~~Phypoly_transcript_00903.p1  ORF type:complete len:946 (+),score=196.05 Phypoly_transcript_00903:148-2838(+)
MEDKKVHDFGGDRRKRGYVRDKEMWDNRKKEYGDRDRDNQGGREPARGDREGNRQTRWDGGSRDRERDREGENSTARWDGGSRDGEGNRPRWDGGSRDGGRPAPREDRRDDRRRDGNKPIKWDGGSRERERNERDRTFESRDRNFEQRNRDVGGRERRDRNFGTKESRFEGKNRGRDDRSSRYNRDNKMSNERDRGDWQKKGDKRFGVEKERGAESEIQKGAIKETHENESEEGNVREEGEEEDGEEEGEEEKEMMRGQQEAEMKRKKREEGGEKIAQRDPLEGSEEIGDEEIQLLNKHQHEDREVDPDTIPDYIQTGEVDKGSWEHLEMLSRCPGCGCLLQSEDPHKIGFTPASVVDSRMSKLSDKAEPKQELPNSYQEGDPRYAEGEKGEKGGEEIEAEGREKTNRREVGKEKGGEEEGEKEEGEKKKKEKERKEGEIEAEDEETKRMLEMEELRKNALPMDEDVTWGEDYMETYYESPEQEERLLQRDIEKQKKYNVEPEYMAYLENLMGKKKKNRPLICQRCYLLKNYNRVVPIRIPVEEFRERLSRLADVNCVVIKVVDLFDFSGTFVSDFRQVVGNNPVILIGNKRDLLPKDIHEKRIIDWMRHEAKLRGLQVSRVHLLSSLKGEGLKEFMDDLKVLRRDRDVYVVGCSNVGKSTFINKLIKTVGNKVANLELLPTTSPFPGTTLNLISVPIWQDAALYDTPGIYNDTQMVKLLEPEELKLVYPRNMVKPSKKFIEPGRSIFLGGLVRIDYIEGPPAVFSFYVANTLPVHLTKLEKAHTIYEKHLGGLLTPPIGPQRAEVLRPLMISKEFVIPAGVDIRHAHHDLVISGLGWIAMHGKASDKMKNCVVKIHFPRSVGVSIRDPLVPMTKFEKSKGSKRRERAKKRPVFVK